mgnify:CR=1 FL=1
MTSQQNDSKRHSVHTASAVSRAKHRLGAPPLRARLTMFAAACPMIAQALMMVILLLHGQWLFAAMIAPGIFACLVSLLLTLPSPPGPEKAPDPQQATIDVGITGDADDRAADLRHAPSQPIESLLHFARLPWRAIVGRWLEPLDLAVPIGMTGSEPLMLDLNRQGPHALVAGTTGSGKSVLLQSWCLALASMNGPEHLNFVFLDFKGGSAFRKLERLPHTVGSVCDLDLAHAVRALRALEAELTRREQLSAAVHASDIRDMVNPPPRLIVVIDEFHALRDRLPDYMQRLNRLASLGRSLGMHLIVCTQNPMGQVHADMKANISLSICLRVTDQMQSNELIGTKDAALIPPAFPGAAYCHDGQRTVPFRCSAVHDIDSLVHAINTASAFSGTTNPSPLFSAPLAPHAGKDDLTAPQREAWHHVPFALSDDGVLISTAFLDVGHGNIAVIGACGSGKTNLLLCCASRLYESGRCTIRFTRKTNSEWTTDDGRISPQHERTIWFVDDADELLSPFAAMPEADKLKTALADPSVTVIAAVEKPQSTLLERCLTRVAFPCGERATDVMMGIPSAVLDGFGVDDYAIAGRGVFIQQARACPVQCAEFQGF